MPWMILWVFRVSAWHQCGMQRGEHEWSNGGSCRLAVKQRWVALVWVGRETYHDRAHGLCA